MRWQPTTTHQARELRAQVLRLIRNYFYQQKVLEVETPALSQAGNTDPFIESFQFEDVQTSKATKRYLHSSPEYPMKRLLAADSGDIYQICKVWRKGEFGKNHNPEFTLLEWYRLGFDYHQLIEDVSQLLHAVFSIKTKAKQINKLPKTDKIVSYADLFLEKFNINPHIASLEELTCCAAKNIESLSLVNLDQQALLDALLTHCIEPDFDKDCLTFVIDYPVTQSALATIRHEKNYSVAERFEVYFGQTELGNGYQEETSYQRNKEILQSENKERRKRQLDVVTEDEFFLEATKNNIPYCSGVAIGIDRILMCLSNGSNDGSIVSIQKVINFPWDVA